MRLGHKETFGIEKKLRFEDDKSAFGFGKWDYDSIRRAIKKSKEEKNLPQFQLSKIEIHPSGFCNFCCSSCSGGKLAPRRRTNLHNGIMEEVLRDIRKNMPDENPFIVISGLYSEPLLSPDIKNILKQLGEYKFRFGLYTNGLVMDDEMIDSITESARKYDGIKPSYVSFNISASLDQDILRTNLFPIIRKLNKRRNKLEDRTNLDINAPILLKGDEKNDFLHGIINDLLDSGVNYCRLSFPWSQHCLRNSQEPLSQDLDSQDNRTVKIIEKLRKDFGEKVKLRLPREQGKYSHCYSMTMSLSISPEGDVYPCPEKCTPYFRDRFSYGSVLTEKLSNIWRSKKHLKLFNSLDPEKRNCRCCPKYNEFNEVCEKIQDR